MRTPHLYWATYGIVQNEKNEILMLQRQNTGYFDGWRCLPAGHIEQGELSSSSIQHEILEEIGVTISPDDAKLFYVLHRINDQASGSREYMDLCYTIKNRTWDIKNTEPDKCSDLQRFAHDSLPDYMSVENRLFIEHYFSHWDEQIRFGEIDERE